MKRILLLLAFTALAALPGTGAAQTATLSTVYSFCSQANCTDGYEPLAGLAQGGDGSLYGTTESNIFKAAPDGTVTSIYEFSAINAVPPSSLVQGADGNFYGVDGEGANGQGAIFKVTPAGALTVLHSFCSVSGCADGGLSPVVGIGAAPLLPGSDGNFYGTTNDYGAGGAGTIFRMTPAGALTTIYSFCALSACADGGSPEGGLLQGGDGNFYGTASAHGANGNGTAFRITPAGVYTVLYSFCAQADCTDGGTPYAGLTEGNDGNFYGDTFRNGTLGSTFEGTMFQLTPGGTFTVLHTVCTAMGCPAGANPASALTLATDGNFYGTTEAGGDPFSDGVIYRMSPAGTFTLLYTFAGAADGANPNGMVQANDGNFYGTTSEVDGDGAGEQAGTLFRLAITPALAAPVQLSASPASVAAGSPVTLSWKVANAVSTTMQQCYGFATGGGVTTALGKAPGTLSGSTFAGSLTFTAGSTGTYDYALTCGGTVSGFATVTVTKEASAVALTSDPASPTVGQPVTLTAKVSGAGGTPEGSVSFSYGSLLLASVTLDGGSASYTASTNGLAPGTYPVTAEYAGSASYNGASSTENVKLGAPPTAVTLSASPGTVTPPGAVTLMATVKRSAVGASGTPTGTVTFFYEGLALDTATLDAGVATYSASSNGLAPGSYAVTATYNGDSEDVGSSSKSVTVTVQ